MATAPLNLPDVGHITTSNHFVKKIYAFFEKKPKIFLNIRVMGLLTSNYRTQNLQKTHISNNHLLKKSFSQFHPLTPCNYRK